MKFRYRSYTVNPKTTLSGKPTIHRPEVKVRMSGPRKALSVQALVDTGADQTLFPESWAHRLEIELDKSKSHPVLGVGGHSTRVTPAKVNLALIHQESIYSWSTTVAFAEFESPKHENVLLGHEGFLDLFRVIFDGQRRELIVEPTSNFYEVGKKTSQ